MTRLTIRLQLDDGHELTEAYARLRAACEAVGATPSIVCRAYPDGAVRWVVTAGDELAKMADLGRALEAAMERLREAEKVRKWARGESA